ncbi:MAG: DUF86 domain-containing protein [Planctomycetia bacterium]|nr:DUF86 domain-containing protein [Planctomycetia bacterium]
MQTDQRDAALLWDMREAAKEILDFTEGMNLNQFESGKVVRYAVERQLLVIGEAARQVSSQLKRANPHIPWNAIIGQRNILAHEYGEILVERIWRVASERIPELVAQLDPLIPNPPE